MQASLFYARIREASKVQPTEEKARYYKQILETLFRELTKEESRSFGNLFARMLFFFDKHNVPTEIKQPLVALRILTQKATRDSLQLHESDHHLCLKALIEVISWYYQEDVPADLQSFPKTPGQLNSMAQQLQQQAAYTLKGVIINIQSSALHLRNEEYGDFSLTLTALPPTTILSLQTLLRTYDTILATGCKTENDYEFVTTHETQIVLEPDLLIDISDLAECFTHKGANKLLYLVKKLVPQFPGAAAFRGNLVNTLLDEMLRNRNTDMKKMFMEAVAENIMQATAFGRTEINKMYSDIKDCHWPNLQQTVAELQHKAVRIEPAFYSAIYGLQGRLDLMTEEETDDTRKEIYELKSGRAPDFHTWKNHEMQVVGYNLLLKSTFGRQRKGSSAILYSSAAVNPLRNVTSTLLQEGELLMLRNEIVAMLLRLAIGEMDILSSINAINAQGLPSFSINHFNAFQQAWELASPTAKAYYKEYLSFTIREYLQAKCGMFSAVNREEEADGFAALWLQDEKDKKSKFNIIPGLRFREFDTQNSLVKFDLMLPVTHNFRKNDTAVIYPRSKTGLQPLKQQLLKGRIEELGKGYLTFSLINRQMTLDFFSQFSEWVIEHDIYESNYWSSAAFLFYMLAPQYSTRANLILGLMPPRWSPLPMEAPVMFNDNQTTIVRQALEAQDYYLLQGPPGTGKTSSLLTTIVNEKVKQGRTTIIVAFTNKAVEEICSKLESREIGHLRLGGRNTEAARLLQQYCLDGSLEKAKNYITSHKVFVATVSTMTSRLEQLMMIGIPTDTLIVDEASQLTEPQILGLLMPFRKFILIGDQNQLPPVVAQDESYCRTTQPELNQLGIYDLRTSMFERLMHLSKATDRRHAWGMLNTHFRMHNTIADLVNHYYAGQLTCGRREQHLPFIPATDQPEGWERILAAGRKVFISSPYETTSKMNLTEAQWVRSLLQHLRARDGNLFNKDRVGVVTPWRTQIALIRELIADDEELQAINIDTVERFQGSENDIIIVSLAVYHAAQLHSLQSLGRFKWEEEEVEVDRKLLVTLSRAKQQVILLGHLPVLQSSAHYSKILSGMTQSWL
ncbi:hypothetical protein DVR12_10710 [Chitinophaga silvatica]|uniref:Uncharacterized protein n=1 Tax=Chitinophaga silvatica TaxID=2282649 RepID=A0A3E1YBL0_9BACT|nr:AAA domain-containing protein [Chitinophaga silvatica]RFS23477.1 hypothetical protein DVR12_10710 [Chitinophaga silvatica]